MPLVPQLGVQVRRERDRLPHHAPRPQRSKDRHYRRRRQPPEKSTASRAGRSWPPSRYRESWRCPSRRRSSTGGAASLPCPFTSASRRCPTADGPRRSTPPNRSGCNDPADQGSRRRVTL